MPPVHRPAAAVLVASFLTIAACAGPQSESSGTAGSGVTPVRHTPIGELPDIDIDAVLAHTKILSSDGY